jgi:hypothetical protein
MLRGITPVRLKLQFDDWRMGFDRMMFVRERGAVKEAMLGSSCYAFVAEGNYCENQTDHKYSCFHFGFRRLSLRAGR